MKKHPAVSSDNGQNAEISSFSVLDAAAYRTENARMLAAYWNAARGSSLLAARSAIEPRELLSILPYVIILEVPDRATIRFRLIGSAHDRRLGADYTGRNLLDLVPAPLRDIRARQYWDAATHPCGLHVIRRMMLADIRSQDYELIMMPVQPRGEGGPAQLFGAGFPLSGDWRSGVETHLADVSDRVSYIDIGVGAPAGVSADAWPRVE